MRGAYGRIADLYKEHIYVRDQLNAIQVEHFDQVRK